MGKIWVEICLISARGLRRTSALWKLQWFAVGWIDPNNKYCTKIDASGNANPVWKTKFSILVDSSESNFNECALSVEVYSREPIFLRERLQGTAAIVLKEFLDKYSKNSEVSKPVEEVGSFQLRKRNSNKPQGFVDVSIRISEKEEELNSYPDLAGDGEGFRLHDRRNSNAMANPYGPAQSYPPKLPLAPSSQQPENESQINVPYKHPMSFPTNYSNSSAGGPSYQSSAGPSYQPQVTPRPPPSAVGPGYQPPKTPPPPPPPSNVGYISTFNPRTDNLPPSYINMPSSGAAPGHNSRPGLGLGLGAGALAAGAVIFGDDFMSGYDLPSASFNISTDLPF
ncbi:actin cytoskeleton-regulatory complex protein pan1 isoform X1 [Daucus carota subsp. sativus]|uniref:actin cytoskeleton-regulatory complex protein pan1 isoform X1 n=1 Tax=Daucus carota subsp. sativus TaxID=79200 RepID=UPI0007EF65AC|nr:PREDICTED: actin cytoskeleton-regulatory complex protein pan1 isoform X1 [Daucus carota subsp. sativus]